MSVTIADERRALAKDELELVEKTHLPALDQLERKDLTDLAKRLRNQRDKARDQAHQQRREKRGKSAPRGTTAAKGDAGQTMKKQIFASALKRVNRRIARLDSDAKKHTQVAASQRALARKREAQANNNNNRPDPGRTKSKGIQAKTNPKGTVKQSGAEKGRVSQSIKQGQAKRDSK